MKKGWRLLIIVLGSLVLLLVLLTTGVALILSPERLTGMINRYAGQYLNASVTLSEARVNILKNYPNLTITLKDGQIIVPCPDPEKAWEDSLLTFNKIEAVIRPLSLIRKRLLIPSLTLEHTAIRLFTNTADTSNWEIFKGRSRDTLSAGYTYSIGKLSASDTLLFSYEDMADTVIYRVNIREMTAKSPLTGSALKAGIDSYSNTLIVGKDTLFHRIPFLVRGYITLENNFDDYYFRDCETVLGNVPLYINGFMGLRPDSLELKAICRIDSTCFEDFSEAVPDRILPPGMIQAPDLPLSLEVQLNGAYYYGSGEFPVYAARLEAGPGSLSYVPLKLVFPSFQTGISSSFDPHKGDEGTLNVHYLEAVSPAWNVSLAGTLSSMFLDPSVQVSAKTHFILDSLGSLVTDLPRHTAKGEVNALLEADCRLSDLNFTGLGHVMLRADVSTNGFSLDIPSDSLFCLAGTTRIRAAADPGKALDADLATDSLHIRYKGRELAKMSQTVLTAKSTPGMFTRDSTRVQPLEGTISGNHLDVFINDTTRIGVDQGLLAFSMRPDQQDERVPYIETRLDAAGARGEYGVHNISLSDLTFSAGLTYNRRWVNRRDSLIRTSRRSSDSRRTPRIQHEFSYADLAFDLDRESRGLLRKWDINGALQASGIHLVTPSLPLHTQMHSLNMTLDGDHLEITNTRVKAGRSDLLLNGYIENIRRVLLGRGTLNMNFDLQSDTLDTNELIKAIGTGPGSGSADLLIIPGNISLQVVLAVSNAYYHHLQMTNLHGMLRAADRYLQLDGLEASSNAGDISINALYATPDKNNLQAGLDIEMKDVLLEEVTRLLPSMDTLFPMINSFRGLADVQLSVTSGIDTQMNLKFSTLRGACRIAGYGLVLLDGQTFSDISRKLMFRKKALNLIDSIRVEATMADNRIDVFPFIMEMDRYRAAIAGSHNIDRTFHYHISMLRSPVPFRFGLDVRGTPDDYDIDLGRIRFTDERIPVLSYRIDSIRVNLRETIRSYFENYTFD
jgi:hypothetical protein